MEAPKEIRKRFLANAEKKYQEFSEKISVPKDHPVIGIRMPVIKQFAKDIAAGDWRKYLRDIKDEYHEDLLLRGFIIVLAEMDDDERFGFIQKFIPKIDNWAVCDSFTMLMKVKKKNADAFWKFSVPYLRSKNEFEVRFAVVMMLAHFVDEEHIEMILRYVDALKHDAYYVKMAAAWCIADCFIKFPKETMIYLKKNTLDDWTFNKALSKITDSFRVSDDAKAEIRRMRRK